MNISKIDRRRQGTDQVSRDVLCHPVTLLSHQGLTYDNEKRAVDNELHSNIDRQR